MKRKTNFKSNFKFFVISIFGGMIPLAVLLALNQEPSRPKLGKIQNKSTESIGRKTALNFSTISTGLDFVNASENSLNAVVHVTTKVETTSFQRDIFSEFLYGPGAGGRELKQYGSGSGSGVIVSTDGYIVTNNHVIEDAQEIEVTLNDNRKYTAAHLQHFE